MALLGIGAVRLKTFLGLLTVFFFCFLVLLLLLKISSPIHLFLGTILHQHLHQDHDYDIAGHHIK